MKHIEGTFTGYGGLELYAQCWRPEGEARATLAVVHGFGEHSGRYGNVVNWFVPKGYIVCAFDMRGMGRSPGRRGHINSWTELREDTRAFLQWARAQDAGLPLFLLGHSQGGLVVLDYALHYPQGLAGVVASGPTLGKLPVSPPMIMLARLLSSVWPRFTQDVKLDATALSRDPAVPEAYVSDPLVHGLATARLGTEILKAIEWVQAHAADMAVPCLIVHGGADRLVPPEGSRIFFEKMTLADKTRYEYEGYYHEVYNDVGKERVLADVEAWLESHMHEA
ncbi:MAG: alpha/beta hydrolase [Anaerolineae bacterium]|nr:alpha/beta hydrolase [Anaerolineae bacterium]